MNKTLVALMVLMLLPALAGALTIQQGYVVAIMSAGGTSGTGPYTYQWFVRCPTCSSNVAITGATQTSYYFNTNGTTNVGNYTFMLQATDSLSNVANSLPVAVTVVSPSTFFAGNTMEYIILAVMAIGFALFYFAAKNTETKLLMKWGFLFVMLIAAYGLMVSSPSDNSMVALFYLIITVCIVLFFFDAFMMLPMLIKKIQEMFR